MHIDNEALHQLVCFSVIHILPPPTHSIKHGGMCQPTSATGTRIMWGAAFSYHICLKKCELLCQGGWAVCLLCQCLFLSLCYHFLFCFIHLCVFKLGLSVTVIQSQEHLFFAPKRIRFSVIFTETTIDIILEQLPAMINSRCSILVISFF